MKRGFTLIELLVVIAIVALLASIIISSLSTARARARDSKKKMDLEQLVLANELYLSEQGVYVYTAGWLSNWNPVSNSFSPTYIPITPNDPVYGYQYWRKDYTGYSCMTLGDSDRYAFYALLEEPTAQDLATIEDSFDECVRDNWGLNYKVGN
jgi:prepilin-type N-terminal cleavage/methylation domain-containing protein